MEKLHPDLTEKLEVLADCVRDLQKFFRGGRTEFRDMKFLQDPQEGPNERPIAGRQYEGGGAVEVWITIDQLKAASEELVEFSRKIDAGEVDETFISTLRSRIDGIHQLVTCEAANLRYFDLWRATHNQHPGCGIIAASSVIGGLTISTLIKSENATMRTLGYILIGMLSLSAVLKFLEKGHSPKVESDRIRQRLHAVFPQQKEDSVPRTEP